MNTIKASIFFIVLFSLLSILSSCSLADNFAFYENKYVLDKDLPAYCQEKYIETKDGEKIQTLLINSQKKSDKLLIYFHGNASNIYHIINTANSISQLNCNVLLVSYRGYAKSSGQVSEEGIYLDGNSALNYALDSLKYKTKDIILYGRSIGTTVAVELAQNKTFHSIILISPLTSGSEMAKEMGFGWFSFLAGNSFNSIEKIKNVSSPLLIIHGDKDYTTPHWMGKKLFDTHQGLKKMLTIENAGHNNIKKVNPSLYWNSLKEFISLND